jgi:acetyltransferase-like isoleucine patch superfamily enzyme
MKKVVDLVYFLLSFLSLFTMAGCLALAAAPAAFLFQAAWRAADPGRPWLSALRLSSAFGAGFVLFIPGLMLLTVLLRNLFWLRNREGAGRFYQLAAVRTTIYNFLLNINRLFSLPFVRGTPLMVWFYRGMGCRIGRDTFILTTRLWDVDLIEIGDGCLIGGNVAVNAHVISHGKGALRRVRIGNGVTIGADTLVLPGAQIEDQVVVGAGSVVPLGARLERCGVYEGVPLKKVR